MAQKGKHIIKSQVYRLTMAQEEGALAFHDRVSHVNELRITPLIDRLLDKYQQEGERLYLPLVELNLGLISKDNFEQELQYRVEEELQYFLENNLRGARLKAVETETEQNLPHLFEKLSFYLRKGYLKWNNSREESAPDLLHELIKDNKDWSRKEMLALGKAEQVRKRLIYQFNDELLEKLSVFLDPLNGRFIVDFKINLVQRQEKKQLVSVTTRNFRNSVWEIILEYLFVQTGSYSNRKALLKHLLEKIARRHGLTYSSLLQTMVESIDTLPLNLQGETEFFKILLELGKENKKLAALSEGFEQAEMAFEEKIKYFFTHASLPLGNQDGIQEEIWNFIRNRTAEARVFFRNLFKSNKAASENLQELLSTDLIGEIIKIVEMEHTRKCLYFFESLFENKGESHFIPSELLERIRPSKNQIILAVHLHYGANNKQLLFQLLMAIKLVLKIDNALFLRLLAGVQQILPSGFISELNQLRQFIVLPAQTSARETINGLDRPEEKQEIKINSIDFAGATESRQSGINQLLLQWYAFVQTTGEMNRQSAYLLRLLQQYALEHKVPMKQVLLQAEDELQRVFNQLIPNWQLLWEQLTHKTSWNNQNTVPEEWKEGTQKMLSFIREQLKRSFDGMESLQEFSSYLDKYAQEWRIGKTELLQILRQLAQAEKLPEWERMHLFFDAAEHSISDHRILPGMMSRQVHMNEMESRHHQLRKLLFDLRNLLHGEQLARSFEMRLFDVVIALSRQMKLSKLMVVQQLQHTLAWAIPEGDPGLEEQLQLAEEQFRKQVKDSRFTSDLVQYYLAEKALPWWAASISESDLKRHASLYVSLFPKQLIKLQKQRAKAQLLFQLIDVPARQRLIQSVWGNIPRKFQFFHQQLENLIIRNYEGVRIEFDRLITQWHLRLWRILADPKKKETLPDFLEFYLSLMREDLGIEPDELQELINFQQHHPYFERSPVKKILRQVFQRTQHKMPPGLQERPSDNEDHDTKGRKSLTQIISEAESHKPVREDELLSELVRFLEEAPELFHRQLLQNESRGKLLHYLSEKNREKLAYASLQSEKRSELEQLLRILSLLKSYLTSTQQQQLLNSFYELYFLKMGTDKPVTWKNRDWAWLIYSSLRASFHTEKADKLLKQLRESGKLSGSQPAGSKMLDLALTFVKNKALPVKKANELVHREETVQSNEIFEGDELYLPAAGLVLVAPHIPRLLEMLGYMSAGHFNSEEERQKAVYALYFTAYGRTDAEEWELGIPKLLCGIPLETPVFLEEELTREQQELIEGMLQAVIAQWSALKQTSIAGLRETFLQREAKLTLGENHLTLQVKQQTLDILIDRIPWSISKVKLSWMPKMIQVEWR